MVKQPTIVLVRMYVPQQCHHLIKDFLIEVHAIEFVVAATNGRADIVKIDAIGVLNAQSVPGPNVTEKPNVKIGTNQVAPIEGSEKVTSLYRTIARPVLFPCVNTEQ